MPINSVGIFDSAAQNVLSERPLLLRAWPGWGLGGADATRPYGPASNRCRSGTATVAQRPRDIRCPAAGTPCAGPVLSVVIVVPMAFASPARERWRYAAAAVLPTRSSSPVPGCQGTRTVRVARRARG